MNAAHPRVRANIDISDLVLSDPDRIVHWVEEACRATARLMDLAGLRG